MNSGGHVNNPAVAPRQITCSMRIRLTPCPPLSAGLEQCKMLRPAYAVEYDYLPAHQCNATLETKRIGGLFFSGQLNGTTGG